MRGRTITLVAILAAIGLMVGITSYSVTLYRLFCRVTGAGGTTQRVVANTATPAAATITVFFDTSVAPNLPWRFVPVQRSVRLHLGQDKLVFFEAENLSDQDIVGHATFNVTPDKMGPYFKKIACFCFSEERLAAHARVVMPVDFYVDPAMLTNADTTDVDQVTLSYTFFRSVHPAAAQDLARLAVSSPDATRGAGVFAGRCAACHALDRAVAGPPLGGVAGREAGSVTGYPYSQALRRSGVVWTAQTLDTWLAGPADMVPGVAMGVRLDDAAARRDVVAYLLANPGAKPSPPSAPPLRMPTPKAAATAVNTPSTMRMRSSRSAASARKAARMRWRSAAMRPGRSGWLPITAGALSSRATRNASSRAG